jgi:hypothetical protein
MSMAQVIVLPNALAKNLDKEEEREIVEFFNKLSDSAKTSTIEIVEERFERRLTEETSKLRVELIKWMFIFWIGQVAVLGSLILALVHK